VDGIEWDRQKWGPIAKRAFRTGASFTGRYADTLVFDSQAIGEIWERTFDRTGTFIPYGADRSPSTLPLHEDLRHRGYILVVARFVPENTIGEFFAAAQDLSQRHDVVIVGSTGFNGEFDHEAGKLATLHPRVRWLGHVSDDPLLQSLWSHAGAYFHGHTVGGTNPALVQAMASGAPTVAVDTVFNREVLGEAGLFVEPNAPAITASLDALMGMSELQNDLSTAAIRRAELNYSWEGVCREYLSTLETAAELTPSIERRREWRPATAPTDPSGREELRTG
jgi:glycosyltransferase involved in cell wall biosynthesis